MFSMWTPEALYASTPLRPTCTPPMVGPLSWAASALGQAAASPVGLGAGRVGAINDHLVAIHALRWMSFFVTRTPATWLSVGPSLPFSW